ncbi:MAG: hypothetical protein H6594_01385 [Flavobacteriales bacterium]|nr:hypothetical protein [Flavobacteriales bacterium]
MRNVIPLALLFASPLFGQTSHAYTQVYGDSVFADTAFTTYPGTSACPGAVTIAFPLGEVVDSVHVVYVFYSYPSYGGGTVAMERSLLRCTNTGLDEGALTTCTTCSPLGEHYERTTSIANGVSSGSVTIELHLGSTRSTSAPNCSVYDQVEMGLWSTTVYTHVTGAGIAEEHIGPGMAWTGSALRIGPVTGTPLLLEVLDLSGRTVWAERVGPSSGPMDVRLPEHLRGFFCAHLMGERNVGHLRFVR